ncbi:MAG: TlpA family protein disulfide reductase [Defluviitaleaceae bacterium]|nr:TlpA family protein disulfide reductase [Defluviitaleaceae bacterium]
MNKKLQVLLVLLILTMLLVIATISYNLLSNMESIADNLLPAVDSVNEEESERQQQASDFTMQDMNGNEVRLSDFFGKPIVLNFWTTWCPSCITEMPYFEQLHNEMGDEIHIIKVNLIDGQHETREHVESFFQSRDYTFPIYFDTSMQASRAYGIRSIPRTFFIDADGYIVAMVQGTLNEQTMQNGIEMAFENH